MMDVLPATMPRVGAAGLDVDQVGGARGLYILRTGSEGMVHRFGHEASNVPGMSESYSAFFCDLVGQGTGRDCAIPERHLSPTNPEASRCP